MGCAGSSAAPASQPEQEKKTEPASQPEPQKQPEPQQQPEPAKAAPEWQAAPNAIYHRLTKIPIKSGSMGDIRKVTETNAFKDLIKSFEGFVGVDAMSLDDSTMLTHSQWSSEEACSKGAGALGTVLKEHLGPYIAGKPDEPWVGPRSMDLAVSGSGKMSAFRVVIMVLKPGNMQNLVDAANGRLADFKAIDGLVNITAFSAGPESAVAIAGYNSKAQLEAATPKIGAIMKESLGPFFGGPPASHLAQVEYSTLETSKAVDAPSATASAAPGAFAFASGLPDCCTSNPENYTVLAEVENARLVLMKVPPGSQDKPHEHPSHSMYFLVDCKLEIIDIDASGKAGDPHVVEVPKGAAPIFPAGAHQVKNVGTDDAMVLFVESYPTCKPCGGVEGFISPFTVAPQCYKVLAENDDWYTGEMTMKVGESDPLHHHKDHLIYVVDGGEVTILPGGDESAAIVAPLKAGTGVPAPMAAPPFAHHILKNTGDTDLKLIFFEMKQ